MFGSEYKRFIFLTVCLLYFSGFAMAAPSSLSESANWSLWLQQQINRHPDVIASKEKMNAIFSLADGREQPVYNPQLETEFERNGSDNNYLIGINQTIDWWGKRGVRKQQAAFSRIAARQSFDAMLQKKQAEALQALTEWQAASQQAELARNQEAQLDVLLDLVDERQRAGDLGQVDAELAFLSLSQKLNETAQALAQLRRVESRLRELLPDWSLASSQIPEVFWFDSPALVNVPEQTAQWLESHPSVVAARAQWDVKQQAADLAVREAKAEPTLGLSAGRETDENVVALNFSIPLTIRNSFNSEKRAARQQALFAEAQYRSIRRKQQFAIEASQAASLEYQQRYERWQSLMQGRDERSGKLLERQWRNGDLSTTEFLLAMQQRTEGLIAGIELRTQFQLSGIEWLLQTGQINAALLQLTR